MKFKFLKKLTIICSLGLAIFGLTGCQSVNHDATISGTITSINVDIQTGKKYAEGYIEVHNNTIYNTKKVEYSWVAYDITGTEIGQGTEEKDFALLHGANGVIAFKTEVEISVNKIEFTSGRFTEYMSLWQTYLVWWIAAIAYVAISVLLYAISIFHSHSTRRELKSALADKIATTATIALLALIICIFPVFFGSWFSTVILFGAFVASAIGAGIVTAIKVACTK